MFKYFALLTLLIYTAFACSGDCMSCHPKLEKTIQFDLKHKPMLTCVKCHSPDSNKMAECGSDCFSCHSQAKLDKNNIKEHIIIRECRDCHMKMKNDLKLGISFGSSSQDSTLRDFLKL